MSEKYLEKVNINWKAAMAVARLVSGLDFLQEMLQRIKNHSTPIPFDFYYDVDCWGEGKWGIGTLTAKTKLTSVELYRLFLAFKNTTLFFRRRFIERYVVLGADSRSTKRTEIIEVLAHIDDDMPIMTMRPLIDGGAEVRINLCQPLLNATGKSLPEILEDFATDPYEQPLSPLYGTQIWLDVRANLNEPVTQSQIEELLKNTAKPATDHARKIVSDTMLGYNWIKAIEFHPNLTFYIQFGDHVREIMSERENVKYDNGLWYIANGNAILHPIAAIAALAAENDNVPLEIYDLDFARSGLTTYWERLLYSIAFIIRQAVDPGGLLIL